MIKIETLEVSGFKGAILGMRNPFKTRDKSDSGVYDADSDGNPIFTIGKNDLALAQKLLRGGDDDAKFMRMIHVQADITAPLYWWKEYVTNKVATTENSESTMHTITNREFTLEDFEYDGYSEYWESIILELNELRRLFLEAKAKEKGGLEAYQIWRQLIQMLPDSYLQKRTVDLNYQTLRRLYRARRHHKLVEWNKGFMDWIKTLPYSAELITYEAPKEFPGIKLEDFYQKRFEMIKQGYDEADQAAHFCMTIPAYRELVVASILHHRDLEKKNEAT